MKAYAPDEEVDFVVVGSGAAGGVMARELARAGHSVVILERGPHLKQQDFKHDEYAHYFNGELDSPAGSPPQSFRASAQDKAVADGSNPMWYAQCVGGSSVHFTANFWRFPDRFS